MSLHTVTSGSIVNISDINQLINVLQQPSGGQEVGHYFLQAPSYSTNGLASWYVLSLSRGSTPVSLTMDASDEANIGYTGAVPSANTFTSGGFHIYDFTAAINPNPRVGGRFTIQY